MTAPLVDPADLARRGRVLTLAFCSAIVLVAVVVLLVVPNGHESGTGLAVGLAVGVLGFLLARWLPARGLRPLAPGERDVGAAGRVLTAAFLAIALAEAPVLASIPYAFATTGDRGAFVVAAPIAIASIILNATGGPSLRRHVTRLESRGGSTGITV